jgi:hypothetical protein
MTNISSVLPESAGTRTPLKDIAWGHAGFWIAVGHQIVWITSITASTGKAQFVTLLRGTGGDGYYYWHQDDTVLVVDVAKLSA